MAKLTKPFPSRMMAWLKKAGVIKSSFMPMLDELEELQYQLLAPEIGLKA